MRTQRGFTLIEIAVVLAIIGILAGMAAPNMINMRNNFRIKGATSDISGMVRSGRGLAMQDNVEHALVVLTGAANNAADDRAVLVKCPPGTDATYNFATITQAMIDSGTGYPPGFAPLRAADIVSPAGIGPGSQGVLTLPAVYGSIPRSTGCSFCNGSGVGAIVFKTDGDLEMTDGSEEGSVTVSMSTKWPTPNDNEMYTITVRKITGEVRVWH